MFGRPWRRKEGFSAPCDCRCGEDVLAATGSIRGNFWLLPSMQKGFAVSVSVRCVFIEAGYFPLFILSSVKAKRDCRGRLAGEKIVWQRAQRVRRAAGLVYYEENFAVFPLVGRGLPCPFFTVGGGEAGFSHCPFPLPFGGLAGDSASLFRCRLGAWEGFPVPLCRPYGTGRGRFCALSCGQ